jgi:hypothetical protein
MLMRSLAEVLEVLQLLPRHRSRDIEHHGDFEALDLMLSAAVFGSLMSSENGTIPTLTAKLFWPFKSVGYLQKRSLDVRRAIRNHRYPIVADGEGD